jgi:hypothetical protein
MEEAGRMQRNVSRWLIEYDPDDTRRGYARMPAGMDCTCNQCRNFDAAAGRTFPREFIALAGKCQLIPNSFVPIDPEQWKGYNTLKTDPSGGNFMSKQSVKPSAGEPW